LTLMWTAALLVGRGRRAEATLDNLGFYKRP
jgi:hypothetical protein